MRVETITLVLFALVIVLVGSIKSENPFDELVIVNGTDVKEVVNRYPDGAFVFAFGSPGLGSRDQALHFILAYKELNIRQFPVLFLTTMAAVDEMDAYPEQIMFTKGMGNVEVIPEDAYLSAPCKYHYQEAYRRPIMKVEDAAQLDTLIQKELVVAIYYGKKSNVRAAFLRARKEMGHYMNYAIVQSDELLSSLGIALDDSRVVIYQNIMQSDGSYRPKEIKYGGDGGVDDMLTFFQDHSLPDMGVLPLGTKWMALESTQPTMLIMREATKQERIEGTLGDYLKIAEDLAMGVRKKLGDAPIRIFAGNRTHDSMYASYGLLNSSSHLVLIYSEGERYYCEMEPDYTVDGLVTCAEDFLDGKMFPLRRSSPLPEGPKKEKNVHSVVGRTIPSHTASGDDVLLIEGDIYAREYRLNDLAKFEIVAQALEEVEGLRFCKTWAVYNELPPGAQQQRVRDAVSNVFLIHRKTGKVERFNDFYTSFTLIDFLKSSLPHLDIPGPGVALSDFEKKMERKMKENTHQHDEL